MTPFRACKSAPQRGIALVLTLAVLVIASVLLLGFFAASQQNRIATNSYSRGLQAQELALGALAQITGDLRSEIINSSTKKDAITSPSSGSSSDPVNIYVPNTPADIVPRRLGFDTTSANLVNLIRRSAVSQMDSPAANATDSSSVASVDGRKISAARWNKPLFLTPTSKDDDTPVATDFVAPDWIVVTRNGPRMDAKDGDVADFKDSKPSNDNFAIGRFAYAIYDEGGLLNVNVAGSPFDPTTGTPGEKRQTGGKETAAWADLTQIGLTQAEIDTLGQWRNPNTWGDKSTYATETATDLSNTDKDKDSKGFTRVRTGDNALLSRQELIDFVKAKGLPETILPDLTTFSVALNSPSYLAPNSASQADKARMQMGRYFFGTDAQGHPIPLRRFPLNTRLKLLDTGTDTANISKYFGLTKGGGWSNPGYRYWQYDSSKLVGGHIGTIEDAINATPPREPNFFEILKTAILEGSLGTQAGYGARKDYKWEGSTATSLQLAAIDNQVVRIAANIIDQHDADNFPTTIRCNNKDFYGIEDLPYFSQLFVQYTTNKGTSFTYKAGDKFVMNVYHYFQLWNPHQAPPTPPAAGLSPTAMQIRADSGSVILATVFNYDGSGPQPLGPWAGNSQNVTFPKGPNDIIDVNPTSYNSYRNPHIVQDGTKNQQTLGGSNYVNAFLMKFWDKPLPASAREGTNAPVMGACNWRNTVFVLDYFDGGNAHPYATLSGLADGTGTGGIAYGGGGATTQVIGYYNATDASSIDPFLSYAKPDPRTDRLGINTYAGVGASRIDKPLISTIDPYSKGGLNAGGGLSTFNGAAYPGTLVTNQGGAKAAQAFDNDAVPRPGDAYLAEPQADPMTVTSARPVILNRPFRSVAELGYAFRDQPWKTLNFFSKESADAALLDVFCLEDTDARPAPASGTPDTRNNLIAGQVNLNTRNKQVLAALFSGTISKYPQGVALNDSGSSEATDIADQLTKFTNDPTTPNPILTPSELVTEFMESIKSKLTAPYSPVKQEREAIIRALASTGQARTWNLLVDVIAQSGRFPNSASTTDLSKFQVEGERRYWLHVAIDRLTGEVIAKELEPVVE
jgi:Tfp pilus assembly protein PilX